MKISNWPISTINLNLLQAVIFDLDDTLYPEKEFVLSGYRAVATWSEENLGIPAGIGYRRLVDLFESGVRGDSFDRWLVEFGHSQAKLVPQLVQVYRYHAPDVRPFDGVPQLLKAIGSRYRLGLVSDGYLTVQQQKLASLGLAQYLDAVVFSDEWGRDAWKPSVRPFQAILERLDVQAGQAAYVADNPVKDFLGARKLGMPTIWLRRGEGEYKHLDPPTLAYAPDIVIPYLSDLYLLLGIPADV